MSDWSISSEKMMSHELSNIKKARASKFGEDTSWVKEANEKAEAKIKNKYPADEHGTWQILGAPAYDVLTRQYEKRSLGLFQGTYEKVSAHAFSLGRKFFVDWSSVGDIIKMKKQEVTVL